VLGLREDAGVVAPEGLGVAVPEGRGHEDRRAALVDQEAREGVAAVVGDDAMQSRALGRRA
jgi:hypothetical protein